MSMTYIDGLDQDSVTLTLADKGAALTERWHTDDPRFALYLQLCNQRVQRIVGLGLDDMEDFRWRDSYDDGLSPRDAVAEAVDYWGLDG